MNILIFDHSPSENSVVGNANLPHDEIRIPSFEILSRPSVVRRMAIVLKNLLFVSRRERPAQFMDILNSFDGDVFGADSIFIDHTELDPWVILGFLDESGLKGDPSGWWIGAFLRWAEREPLLKTKNMKSRLELIYLVIAIKYPNLISRILQ